MNQAYSSLIEQSYSRSKPAPQLPEIKLTLNAQNHSAFLGLVKKLQLATTAIMELDIRDSEKRRLVGCLMLINTDNEGIVLNVGDRQVLKVHSDFLILDNYFEKALRGNFREHNSKELNFTSYSISTVLDLLIYVYAGIKPRDRLDQPEFNKLLNYLQLDS